MCFISSGQLETHYPSGCKDINFPDGTVKHILLDGEEKIEFADGNVQHTLANGDKTIQFPDGKRDIHTKHFKVSCTRNNEKLLLYIVWLEIFAAQIFFDLKLPILN